MRCWMIAEAIRSSLLYRMIRIKLSSFERGSFRLSYFRSGRYGGHADATNKGHDANAP
jgi:hypothetical protein